MKLCSFDKGNGLVILDSADYYSKLDQIVGDESKFTVIEPDPQKPHPVLQKQNSVIYYINTYLKDYIDEEVVGNITPTGAQPGKLCVKCIKRVTPYAQ